MAKNPLCEGDTDKGIHVGRKQIVSPNSMEEERDFSSPLLVNTLLTVNLISKYRLQNPCFLKILAAWSSEVNLSRNFLFNSYKIVVCYYLFPKVYSCHQDF